MSALSGRPKCCWNDVCSTSRSFRKMENSFKFPHHSLFKHSYRLYRLRSPTDNTADGPSALQVPPAAPRAVAVVGLSNIDAYVSPPTHRDLEPGLALAGTGMSRSPGCRLLPHVPLPTCHDARPRGNAPPVGPRQVVPTH